MDAAHSILTPSALGTFASNRPFAWLACAAVLLAAGCSGSEANNANMNNSTSNNTTSTSGMSNNTTSTNGLSNNTTSTNGLSNNTTSTTGTSNNTASTTGTTVTFTLTPLDATTGMMIDAEICLRDTDDCATGTAEPVSIEVPKDSDIAVTLAADGFITAAWYVNVSEDESYNTPLLPEASLAAVIAGFGFSDDPTKGQIFFNAQNPTSALAGVALTLSPNTYEAVLYNGATGPNPALMETESGNGAFVNVDAGTYEMTGAHATLACGAPSGHQQTTAGAAKFDVTAGEATYVFVVCE